MLYPELEKKLHHAEQALKRATSENVVQLCKRYLDLLAEYRAQLYESKRVSGTTQTQSAAGKFPDRNEIRSAIEHTTRERNRTEKLLFSFTTVSAYEAVELFNIRKHQGHDDWELRASGVKFSGGADDDLMTIQDAVDLAGRLRREEYVSEERE